MNSLFTYTWENVNVDVKGKEILKDVSGIANPGEILTIMGASGSGKTTLLEALVLRSKCNVIGRVKLNDALITSPDSLASIVAYVTQHDFFIETLTVREHLTFNAMLRLSKIMSYGERQNRIEQVLNDFYLRNCENVLIGNPEKDLKGITSGEKRRLAVATELLKDAPILIADEPTTCLDSFIATTMIECLKREAQKGKTVICTIHQPSSSIFHMFDQLYMIADGRLAFYGTINEANDYFNSQELKCPLHCNPAEFYIHKLAIIPECRNECLEGVNKICDNYRASEYYTNMETKINEKSCGDGIHNSSSKQSLRCISQLHWLLWRNILNIKRNKMILSARLFEATYFPIIYGLLYFHQDSTKEDSIRNLNGLNITILMTFCFSCILSTLLAYSYEIPIMCKEYSSGLYSVLNYFIAKSLSQMPFNIAFTTFFATIVYFMVNLNTHLSTYMLYVLLYIIITNVSYAFGGLLSSIAPNGDIATKIVSALFLPLYVFGGFYIENNSIPLYFAWLKYLSWFSYCNEAIFINQWHGVSSITCNQNSVTCTSGFNGDKVLELYSMNKNNFIFDITTLLLMYLVLQIATYIALIVRANNAKLR